MTMTDITDLHAHDEDSTTNGEPTTPIESNGNETISALVASTGLFDQNVADESETQSQERTTRRRSSVSILQALVNTSHLLSTNDARRRNFLVGAARHLPENTANDINTYFPQGRLLTIMVVTWNTGEASQLYQQNYTPTARDKAEPKERMLNDMSDILLPTFIDYVSDLIVVCTQEMSVAKKRIDWEILLQEVIGPTHVLFHSLHFGTLSLCIFIRRDLIWFCTEPEEDIVKFKAVGAVRTKASLAITFNLFGTSFMIINSHFEAGHGSEASLIRRSNFSNTKTKLNIPHEFIHRTVPTNKRITALVLPISPQTLSLKSSSESNTSQISFDATKSCDCVLWAGDMNFRVDMKYDDVIRLQEEKKFEKILEKDEFRLLQEKQDESYVDFKEGTIDFPPTYKYDLRSNDDIYTKQRIPSYTDRILYRDKPTSPVECTQYKSVEGVKHSDHKPVIAHFRIKLKPGLNTGHLSYGKFNREIYKRGCKQREHHHSLGVGLRLNSKRRSGIPKSSVCVLQ